MVPKIGLAAVFLLFALIKEQHAMALPSEPSNVDEFIARVDDMRNKAGQKGKKAAVNLNRAGDAFYRRKKYDQARREYWASYPNYPNAHAYLMAGDAYWRSVIQFQDGQHAAKNGCKFDRQDFIGELKRSIDNHFAPGLALAVHDQDQKILESHWYRRATEISTCLQNTMKRYDNEAAAPCVDLAVVTGCLGEPLL